MTIDIDHIIPTPLQDRLLKRTSDVWNQQLTFHKGEYIKIKAPSGTGKTTFVHILYQLRNDYSGQLRFENKSAGSFTANELAVIRQQHISIIFQDMRLFPDLTVRENIELKRIMQKPVKEKQSIDEMAGSLGISHILEQKAGICSYGEQQRASIIRALMQPFDWLIMDEPFSHLDIDNTNKAAKLIAEACNERGAGLLITDLDEDAHFHYNRQLIL